MTWEELDVKLKRVADSHVVQAELLDRLDQKLGQLADASGDHQRTLDQLVSGTEHLLNATNHLDNATNHLLSVTESHNQQIIELAETARNHERRLVGVEDQTALMLSALNSLFQRMDAFMKRLQKGDGHSGGAS